MSMSFSEKLASLRRKHGYSQEQLADRLGVTRQSVSKWESGAALPELAKIIALSEMFDVTVDYLVKNYMTENQELEQEPTAARIEAKVDALSRRVDTSVYQFTSKAKAFGLPLVSIRFSRDRGPTRNSVAIGVVAIGNFAVGVVSIGLISAGVLSVGMIALGVLALGGVSIGVLAIGASAVGIYATGVSAIGKEIAVGVAAVGKTAVGIDTSGTNCMLRQNGVNAADVAAFLKLHHPHLWAPLRYVLALFGT